MSSYRSAYEEYYKNINNAVSGKNNKNKNSNFSKRNSNANRSKYGIDLKNHETIMNIVTKRFIKELTGATILLMFFAGLKCIPTDQVKEMYIKCKQTLNYNISYNDCVNTINTMQMMDEKGTELKIGSLKEEAYNFIEYIKKVSNMQN